MNVSKKWMVVVAVLLGSFTMILNNSMLNPAVPQLMTVFSADAVATGWVITIFMVTMGMTVPVTGYLGDRFGKKKLYVIGLAIFIIGSILGTLSWNLSSLIVFRGLQGIGGGIMMPLSMALIFEAFPRKERGLATGVWGISAMMAPTIGPTFGGFILETMNWKYLFLVNVPFGLIGLWFALRYLPKTGSNTKVTFDRYGFVTITLGVGAVLYALGRMSELSHLTEPLNLLLVALGIGLIYVFVQIERKVEQPLLDLTLFRVPAYTYSMIIASVSSIGLFAGIFLIPLLIQQVYNLGPIMTGLVFLPSALLTGIFMSIGGRILDRKGATGVISSGLIIVTIGTLPLGFLTIDTSLILIFIWMAVRGIGMGLSSMPSTTTGMNAIPGHLISRGSAMNNVIRQMSSALGIVFVSIYYEVRRGQLAVTMNSLEEASIQAINEGFLVITILTALTVPAAFYLEKASRKDDKLAAQV
ncbi:MDR family MFS transporter [Halalkalibacter akibai]|uniref:Multidrug resistance protein n=1 Tax=Halalkalibacter akibai (strain ATCC 43226 / DSM 21942 / CIP 109018 / JCM 9157 / 1139) TaxID=1236973 RepID=W4QWW6_HALA3|nr:MDR family MFS transporter [Halalkalibacter akibai]GAE36586.1 multidrug resistance protein [Halalkalibacter akibai JCM 9157]